MEQERPDEYSEEARESLVDSLEALVKIAILTSQAAQKVRQEVFTRGYRWDRPVRVIIPDGVMMINGNDEVIDDVTEFMADEISGFSERGVEFRNNGGARILINNTNFELDLPEEY